MECEGDEKRWEDSWCGVEVFVVVGAEKVDARWRCWNVRKMRRAEEDEKRWEDSCVLLRWLLW